MRIAEFETVTPRLSEASLPYRLEQNGSNLGNTLTLVILASLAALILTPFVILLTYIASDPFTRDALTAQPAAAIEIALGISVASALIGWPLRTLVHRLGSHRIVEIDANEIRVTDQGLWRRHTWRQPITAYLGLTHHLRTTNAGPRHELILVHPTRRYHVLVALADRMTDIEVAAAASRLGVPLVPPAQLYRLPKTLPPTIAATPEPQLATHDLPAAAGA
ncbi:MAG: hypothetical protein KDJ47_13375 [Hyphomicrobiaceae bacterium]|nr:hypothetical protein [Hyphomicrobiaceae bacterium]